MCEADFVKNQLTINNISAKLEIDPERPTTYKKRYISEQHKLFLVSRLSQASIKDDVKNKIKVIKKITNLPVIAGFGIKNSVDAKKMSSISDGIVIGSSLVNKIEEVYKKKNGLNEIFKFLKSFK